MAASCRAESEEERLRLKENILSLDTYPTQCGPARVPTGGGVCGEHIVGRYYPREEPDALTSARPGLCGGHRATGVPTAITNYVIDPSSGREHRTYNTNLSRALVAISPKRRWMRFLTCFTETTYH